MIALAVTAAKVDPDVVGKGGVPISAFFFGIFLMAFLFLSVWALSKLFIPEDPQEQALQRRDQDAQQDEKHRTEREPDN